MNLKQRFKNRLSANEDTKDRITPVAFAPDPLLFDLPLARPWRRGMAMLCDLMIVAVLTSLDDIVVVSLLLALWLFHKAKQGKMLNIFGQYTNWAVRGFSFLIIASGIYASSQLFVDDDEHKATDTSEAVANATLIGLSAYQGGQCETALCWQPHLKTLINSRIAIEPNMKAAEVAVIVDETLEGTQMSPLEVDVLKTWALAQPQWQDAQLSANNIEPIDNSVEKAVDSTLKEAGLDTQNKTNNEEYKEPATTPMQWLFGVVDDLGLGFGFAAVYFTCFTAWFGGQTLGKMLLNIRIIHLSNKPMGLWDSFGRYGGYGAGLATGLLGFIQIYWDANRQAIQDQISATVVVDITLAAKEGKLVAGILTPATHVSLDSQQVQIDTNAQDDVLTNTPQARLENEK